jgi:hypothetical protein
LPSQTDTSCRHLLRSPPRSTRARAVTTPVDVETEGEVSLPLCSSMLSRWWMQIELC